MAVLILLVFPFALNPIKIFQAKKRMALGLELRRHACLVAADIKRGLYRNETPIEALSSEAFNKATKPHLEKQYEIELPGFGKKIFEMKSFLRIKKTKLSAQEKHFLLTLVIGFSEPGKPLKKNHPRFIFCFALTEGKT